MPKETILEQLHLFSLGGEGIGGWLTKDTDDRVFNRLEDTKRQYQTVFFPTTGLNVLSSIPM